MEKSGAAKHIAYHPRPQKDRHPPNTANNMESKEIWFGVTDDRASQAESHLAQFDERAAIGRRLDEIPTLCPLEQSFASDTHTDP